MGTSKEPKPHRGIYDLSPAGQVLARILFETVGRVVCLKYPPNAKTGMLAKSILADTLLFPDATDTTLTKIEAPPGRLVGYDFERRHTFGNHVHDRGSDVSIGALIAVLPKKYANNAPDKLTPMQNITKPSTILAMERIGISEGIDFGLLEQTTYAAAYDRAGVYDEWEEALTGANVLDSNIYQITPKGNSIVDLLPDMGGSQPRRQSRSVLLPGLVPAPIPA